MRRLYQKTVKRISFIVMIVHLSMFSFATTYYVSNVGNDANSGLSATQSWRTLNKVRAFTFLPGDNILFKRGDIFDDSSLSFVAGGSVAARITISAYGIGEKPEIRGYHELKSPDMSGTPWKTISNWSESSPGIWRMAMTTPIYRLWINGADKKIAKTIALTSEFPWKWETGFLYVMSVDNPAISFKSIVSGTRYGRLVNISSIDNVTFKNLKITGGSSAAIRLLNCNNVTIDSCEVGYRSFAGIVITTTTAAESNNFVISNSILSSGDSLMYSYFKDPHTTTEAILLQNGVTNCKIFNNYMNSWSHGGVFIKNITTNYPCHDIEIYNNYVTAPLIDYARGFGCDYASNGYNVSFHNNTIVNTSISNQFNGNGLKVYDNIIDNTRIAPYPESANTSIGIAISAYETPATNMEIYNNTIRNCGNNGISMNDYGGGASDNLVHDNNVLNCGDYQLYSFSKIGIKNNKYQNNHFYNSKTDKVTYYGVALSADGFNNVAATNGDLMSGNNQNLTYSVPGFGNISVNINDLRIEHNGTSLAKTIAISTPMVDTKGTKYTKSVTIKPYSSIILIKDPTQYSAEYKSICEGSNYNNWTNSGKYERTLKAKSGADSVVTTYLTVNPKYMVTENVKINFGESYMNWSTSGQYSRSLSTKYGCDSVVTTILTVEKLAIDPNNGVLTHYSTVWKGENGQNHMNFIVVSAILEDLPLAVDDEIGIFSGAACVGAKKLTQAINPSDNSTFLSIPTSQNDGSNNGFVDNDTIIFKIWDNKNQKEMIAKAVNYRNDFTTWISTGKFAPGATSVIELVSYNEYTQTIELKKGYNMISTYLTAQKSDIPEVTKSLTNQGFMIKLQDEAGKSYENLGNFGDWINNVGSIQKTEGYLIKVANNCTLQVTGRPVILPLDIPLKTGWNIISFPRTDILDAMTVIKDLVDMGKLIKVQDEVGNSIEYWGILGGWKNGIGNFIPGKAYKVKMSEDAILTIQNNYTKAIPEI